MKVSCRVVSDSAIPQTTACPVSLSVVLSRQEYWSGLPFPSPETGFWGQLSFWFADSLLAVGSQGLSLVCALGEREGLFL